MGIRTIYIGNAFSLSMLDRETLGDDPRTPCPLQDSAEARELLEVWKKYGAEVISTIGHQDVAELISKELGRDLPMNRTSIKLVPGSVLLVGQYVGPRLPEGTTQLPEGSKVEWWVV